MEEVAGIVTPTGRTKAIDDVHSVDGVGVGYAE
jgi:hypothetical protein